MVEKRKNLIDFYLDGAEVDQYITTHLYGELIRKNAIDDSHIQDESGILRDLMNESMAHMNTSQIDESFLKYRKRTQI